MPLRRTAARDLRQAAADQAFLRPHLEHINNGEENAYPKRVANYSKGLPHNKLGEVDLPAYRALLNALNSGRSEHFEAIPLGSVRKLTNPQAGLAYDLEGGDAHSLAIRPAPRIDSAENSAEMAELYWMALLRDTPFADYDSDAMVAEAAQDLSGFSDFRGPKQGNQVTHQTLFRGFTAGDRRGPYVSQFLLKDIPYGTLTISQRQETAKSGVDYLTDFASWLAVQRGANPALAVPGPQRHILNARDLATYVHFDQLYEAYLNACLILLDPEAPAQLDPGNPYPSETENGFGTFGGPHILSLVTEVATRALKAVWFQKWFVHRRLRPEAFGGRIHNHMTGTAQYPIDDEILNSSVVGRIMSEPRFGSYLLPQAFPEGSPTHPAYGAGHATVAGACVTILKAWFDESDPIPNPQVPKADGSELKDYSGPQLTVGGELDKVAANIAIGRNMAGVHWRSDYTESVKLGEAIAISVLEEQKETYSEDHWFTLRKFDGRVVSI